MLLRLSTPRFVRHVSAGLPCLRVRQADGQKARWAGQLRTCVALHMLRAGSLGKARSQMRADRTHAWLGTKRAQEIIAAEEGNLTQPNLPALFSSWSQLASALRSACSSPGEPSDECSPR